MRSSSHTATSRRAFAATVQASRLREAVSRALWTIPPALGSSLWAVYLAAVRGRKPRAAAVASLDGYLVRTPGRCESLADAAARLGAEDRAAVANSKDSTP